MIYNTHYNTTQKQNIILAKNKKLILKNKMEIEEYEMELGQNRENRLEIDKGKKYSVFRK